MYEVGDRVLKKGSYTTSGTIRSIFTTSKGHVRVVFEFDVIPGMLHIFSLDNIEKIDNEYYRTISSVC